MFSSNATESSKTLYCCAWKHSEHHKGCVHATFVRLPVGSSHLPCLSTEAALSLFRPMTSSLPQGISEKQNKGVETTVLTPGWAINVSKGQH